MTSYEDAINDIDMKRTGKIVLTKPWVTEHSNCPRCGAKPINFVLEYDATCIKCNNKFKAKSKPDIYASHAKLILTKLKDCNDLLLCTPTKFEFVLSEILNNFNDMIRTGFINAKIVNKSVFSNIDAYDDKVNCTVCGYCNHCSMCLDCKEYFIPSQNMSCPKCGSINSKPTYIGKIPKNNDKAYCPYCKSINVRYTYFYNRTKCTICGSDKVTTKKPVKNSVLILRKSNIARVD